MVKVLSFRFQHRLDPFTMLFFEGSPETGLLTHWSHLFFGLRNFGNTSAMRVIFYFENVKTLTKFQTFRKTSEKYFCFWDNCIWTGCVKLSLLRTEYLSSALIVLTKSLNILHITNRDFLKLYCLHID